MTKTAKTYGGALYELADEEGISARILDELEAAVGIFRDNPDYVRILSAPSLPKAERCGLIDEAFVGKVHNYLCSFMKILCENGSIAELPGCLEAFRARYNEDNGILDVTAVSAVVLTNVQRERLCAKLAASTGKTIHLSERLDPDCIGGLRIEAAGMSFDGTVSGRLERIGHSLADIAL